MRQHNFNGVFVVGKEGPRSGVRKTAPPTGDAVFRRSAVCPDVVEVTGIEPVSESALTETSPGAEGHLHSRVPPQAFMLRDLVASSFMARAKLTARTFPTHRRRRPGRGPPGGDARYLSSEKNSLVVVL